MCMRDYESFPTFYGCLNCFANHLGTPLSFSSFPFFRSFLSLCSYLSLSSCSHLCQSWGRARPPPPPSRLRCLPRCRRRWRGGGTAWSQTASCCTACGAGSARSDAARCPSCRRWRTGERYSSWSTKGRTCSFFVRDKVCVWACVGAYWHFCISLIILFTLSLPHKRMIEPTR